MRYTRRDLVLIMTMVLIVFSGLTRCASNLNGSGRQSTERLLERTERYSLLFTDKKYAEAYDMLAAEWREGGEHRQEWIKHASQMGKGITIHHRSVSSLSSAGDRVRIVIIVEVETNDDPPVETVTEIEFWQFENGDWYFIPLQLSDWSEAEAVCLALPSLPIPDQRK